jgi:hypothetical protein
MSFAAQTKPAKLGNTSVKDADAKMCLQPLELVLAPIRLEPRRRRVEWIVEGLLPEFDIRAYCRLCLGSGSTTRSARAPTTSRRGRDGRDDGSGGDDGGDGGDGPPGPPITHGRLIWAPLISGRAAP